MGIAWTIEKYDSVKSTQDVVKGMARIGQPEGMVVVAEEQTEGRGRHGRQWVSKKGNLYLSVLLRPSCPVAQIGQLSLLTGLSLYETLAKFIDDAKKLSLKWPNDVLLDGQKCAGILLETELTGNQSIKSVALGIGVNIVTAPPGLGHSLKDYARKAPDLEKIQAAFLKNLNTYYLQWIREDFMPIKKAWLEHGHKKGEKMRVRIGVQIEEGAFHDIDSHGNLLLTDKDFRLKTVTAGEVYI